MNLIHTIRSDVLVNLERFILQGRLVQIIRDFDHASYSNPGPSAFSKCCCFYHLDPGQMEHFREFSRMASQHFCLSQIRIVGKRALFLGKVFLVGPSLLKTLVREAGAPETAEKFCAKNVACGPVLLHIIAPSLPVNAANQLMTLPRYHFGSCSVCAV